MYSDAAWTTKAIGATFRASTQFRNEREKHMAMLGIIGGSGLTRLEALKVTHREVINTPYGDASAPLLFGELDKLEVVFLPRHGSNHTIPPHKVNYRANIWALQQVGVHQVVGMAAVGGIAKTSKTVSSDGPVQQREKGG